MMCTKVSSFLFSCVLSISNRALQNWESSCQESIQQLQVSLDCRCVSTVHELCYKNPMLEFYGNGFYVHDIQANTAWTAVQLATCKFLKNACLGKYFGKSLNGCYF